MDLTRFCFPRSNSVYLGKPINAYLKEKAIWQIIYLSTLLTSKWLRFRGDYPQYNLINLSVKKLAIFLGIPQETSQHLQYHVLRYYLIEAMIVRNADKLVDPAFFFPFSFSNLKNDLINHSEHGSKIILINHIAGFTLLINLIVAVALNSMNQDILILYGIANIDLINKIKSNWIQSSKLHFVLGDRNGLISLKSYLRHGAWLIALIDIPQDLGAQECQPIMFIRDQLYFKTGILRLSAAFNLPILSIVHYLDSFGIVYKLCPIIRVDKFDLQCSEKQKQILESLFAPIAEVISKYPEQWFLWHKVSTT
ncbi:MAG: hypothetical protein MH252_03785 [Thermosynechococcaceae cyanobacterium MS004]|nr:hypothetical protein [Thermosynechococcaceae cyanobacterium MS004]